MREAIVALRSKYEEMRSLRRQSSTSDPRERLLALATQFPGALREIDELPLDEIDRRIEMLTRAEHDASIRPEWILAMTRFHALARGALFAKRTLSRKVDAGESDWPEEARPWRDDLARVKRPPRGRLMDLVYERLGRELSTTPTAAKKLVFGFARKSR